MPKPGWRRTARSPGGSSALEALEALAARAGLVSVVRVALVWAALVALESVALAVSVAPVGWAEWARRWSAGTRLRRCWRPRSIAVACIRRDRRSPGRPGGRRQGRWYRRSAHRPPGCRCRWSGRRVQWPRWHRGRCGSAAQYCQWSAPWRCHRRSPVCPRASRRPPGTCAIRSCRRRCRC
ncbi:hypothetical protein D9M71_119560 [compost metagenome]